MMLKKYFGTKQFYRTVISIAFPIMAQQFITTFVNLIDNVMIGSIGNIALTSVTVANRFFLIMNSILFGLCGAAGIYIAQFFGAKQKKNCQEVFNINMAFAVGAGLLFTLIIFIFPQYAIELFSKTPIIVAEAIKYLHLAKYTYIPFAVSFTCMMALRAVGINKIQLKVGIVAVITNTALNYCLIFGNFGFFKMGIQGAAIATIIARLVEMAIYLIILYRNKHFFSFDLKGIIRINVNLLTSIVRKAIPLTINEILFSLGQALIFMSYMRCDEYLVASISVVDTVANIMFIVFGGLSSAVSIMIGNKLGANKLDEARDNARKLLCFALMVSLMIGMICFLLAPLIPNLYNVDIPFKEAIVRLVRIKSIMINIYAFNVCIFFILRAGGDVVSTMIMDSGFLWAAGVLVSTLLSSFTTISLISLYIVVESLDLIKLIIATYFFKKERWVKNIAVVGG